jgi:hypothetical protein
MTSEDQPIDIEATASDSHLDRPASDAVQLPAWRELLTRLRRDGLEENRIWPNAEVSAILGCPHDSPAFNWALHEVRKALRAEGWVIAQRSDLGGIVLLPRSENPRVVLADIRAAFTRFHYAHLLGSTTPIESLSTDQRKQLDQGTAFAAKMMRAMDQQRARLEIAAPFIGGDLDR